MRPFILQGHERPITQVKYNRLGDLLFTASKDKQPNVWYSLNGERLGTFNGHAGSIWCIDNNWESTRLISGSGDNTLRLWDCQTGKEIGCIETNSAVRSCGFGYCGNIAVYTTDKARGHPCEMFVVDTRLVDNSFSQDKAICKFSVEGPRITTVLWGALNETLITGHDNGELVIWDFKKNEKMITKKEHEKQINDMQFNKEGIMLITASADHTAKLFDSATLEHLKTYKTERPINSATISPNNDHVILGGGQSAMDVTTSASEGKFNAKFYHLVYEEEFATLKGHFGPINSLAFHPSGRSFASGAEDGFIRLNTFDKSYYNYKFN